VAELVHGDRLEVDRVAGAALRERLAVGVEQDVGAHDLAEERRPVIIEDGDRVDAVAVVLGGGRGGAGVDRRERRAARRRPDVERVLINGAELLERSGDVAERGDAAGDLVRHRNSRRRPAARALVERVPGDRLASEERARQEQRQRDVAPVQGTLTARSCSSVIVSLERCTT
jgi:hypothetical protein